MADLPGLYIALSYVGSARWVCLRRSQKWRRREWRKMQTSAALTLYFQSPLGWRTVLDGF